MQVSEWVSLGHPDKTADYISEYILDRYIEKDQNTRYAVEVQIKDHHVALGGEISSKADITKMDIDKFVRKAVNEIGYTRGYQKYWGMDNTISADELEIVQRISRQSNDISVGVDTGGWGDQGIMWGMAVNDPKTNYMPKDIYLARAIGKRLYDDRVGGLDIKTQVYLDDEMVKKVIVAIPLHNDYLISGKNAVTEIVHEVVTDFNGDIVINGTGSYVKHSSIGDCGTTGRKLAVDFYGGNCVIGGGSPWTKDGTKADLSLNMLARKIALNYVSSSGKKEIFCSIACCIGEPIIDVTIYDKCGGISDAYKEHIPTHKVIRELGLNEPIFAKLCREGLFYA